MENDFKEILKDFLIDRGLTQSEFAKQINVKQSQVSEWLKGKCKPSYDIIKSIAKAFNISADFILGLTDD